MENTQGDKHENLDGAHVARSTRQHRSQDRFLAGGIRGTLLCLPAERDHTRGREEGRIAKAHRTKQCSQLIGKVSWTQN
jgi:hypothetical protein